MKSFSKHFLATTAVQKAEATFGAIDEVHSVADGEWLTSKMQKDPILKMMRLLISEAEPKWVIIVSPVAGVTSVFPTKHALGTDNGWKSWFLHIGLGYC